MKYHVLIAMFLAGTTATHAQQTHDASAVATGTQRTEPHVISEGHTILRVMSDYENFEAVDASNPNSTTSGVCFGAVEIIGASAGGGGNCVFQDADGDSIANVWKVSGFGAGGALLGTWTYTGGSGKFAGLTGGGSFSSVTDQATGKFTNTITGAARLP